MNMALVDEPEEDPTDVSQLAFFRDFLVALRYIAIPAPKKVPCKIDGDAVDPADGDILTIQFDVKLNGVETLNKWKAVKGAANYTRTKRQEFTYRSQVVDGSVQIVAHYRPE